MKRILINVICVIIIITSIIYLKSNKIQPAGFKILYVQTGSMSPTVEPGDIIIIKSSKRYNIGEIITYEEEGQLITHRIIEELENGYYTKGDANNAKDDIVVQENQIKGKVIKIIKI